MVEFNPTHHALLFAWIAQEVIRSVGEPRGQAAVRTAVRRYGEQRGGRMSQRAAGNSQDLDMTAYMAYGEWQAPPGMFETAQDSKEGTPRSRIFRCPWHQAWVANGVNEAGRLYCLEIDTSLARGFNPELQLDVNSTRSNGAEACEFIYHDADSNKLAAMEIDRSLTVMPWAYHLGHLYKTMREVLAQELGAEGEAAAQAGLDVFAQRFGAEAAQAIHSYQATDFDHI